MNPDGDGGKKEMSSMSSKLSDSKMTQTTYDLGNIPVLYIQH